MMRPTTNAAGASLVCCFAIGAPPAAYRDAYDPAQPAVFQVAPHRLLMEAVAGRRVGDALKIGMGRDRNTLALAERGWRGTGFDLPTQGIAQAKAVAVVRKLLVVALVANDVEIEYREGKWVLVALIYPPFRRILARFIRCLESGGLPRHRKLPCRDGALSPA